MSELQVLLENSQRRNKELAKQMKDIVVDAGKVSRENIELKAQVETLSVQQERLAKLLTYVVQSYSECLDRQECYSLFKAVKAIRKALANLEGGG